MKLPVCPVCARDRHARLADCPRVVLEPSGNVSSLLDRNDHKRALFDAALCTGGPVSVYCDPQHADVGLPAHVLKPATWTMRLDYGLNLQRPIVDLRSTHDGIAATLSFNRQPSMTFIPWSSVYQLIMPDRDELAVFIWPEDVPVTADIPAFEAPVPAFAMVEGKRGAVSTAFTCWTNRFVPLSPEADARGCTRSNDVSPGSAVPRKATRSHLRLVKR